jgi:uncharacterized repeat protein (TIGR02543 family)
MIRDRDVRRRLSRGRAAAGLGIAACFAAGLLAAAALGSSDRRASDPSLIVPGASIGAVAIGAPRAAVVAAYGEPEQELAVVVAQGAPAGALATYRSHGGRLYVTYDASGAVVGVQTTSSYYRTAGGVGVGVDVARADALPGFAEEFCADGVWSGAGAAVTTIFTRQGGLVASVWITAPSLFNQCAAETDLPPEPPGPAPPRPASYDLSVTVEPAGAGWVRSTPYLVDCPLECVRRADAGSTLGLEAHATSGFTFEGWSGDCIGQGPCSVAMAGHRSVTARFSGSYRPPAPPPGSSTTETDT